MGGMSAPVLLAVSHGTADAAGQRAVASLVAAVAEGEPCVTHVGHDGAGHFVKMVHNGIEYADMQLIAEAYDLIRRATGKTPAEIADIFAEWNRGELESYLIEITAEVLRQTDAATGKPLVDVILDQAGAKGTGAWTVQTALDLGVPVSGIAEATFARSLSSHREQRAVSGDLPGPEGEFTVADADAFIEQVRLALYASKIIAYAQGFNQIQAGSDEYDWDIKPGDMARIWRGGCIIRATGTATTCSGRSHKPCATTTPKAIPSPASTCAGSSRQAPRHRPWR